MNVRVATVTFSDTRTDDDDESGRLLGRLLRDGGYDVVSHAIVREEREEVEAAVLGLCGASGVDAVVATGGTGVAPRDVAIEAVAPHFDKTLDGFGEAFRRLSWEEVGPRAILSRATAGFVRGTFVALLPGSTKAVRLATEALLLPTLRHAIDLARGHAGHHHHHGESAEQRGGGR